MEIADDKFVVTKEQKKAYNRARESIEQRGSIDEDEDEEGFKKLDGELITVKLEQNNYGLGISLAGKQNFIPNSFILFLQAKFESVQYNLIQ